MNFRIYIPPDGGHVGCGIWQRLAPQNRILFEFVTRAYPEESNNHAKCYDCRRSNARVRLGEGGVRRLAI